MHSSRSSRLPYAHGYHAGNAADVWKHSVLVLLLQHMCRKGKPFAFVDTHAGAGLYDLAGEEAMRLREHERGIHRLRQVADSQHLDLGPASDLLSLARELTPQTQRQVRLAEDAGVDGSRVCLDCWHSRREIYLEEELRVLMLCPR